MAMSPETNKKSQKSTPTDGGSKTQGTAAAGETQFTRRLKYGLNVAVLLLSLFVVLAVTSWLTATLNIRFDFTATRAWSLSPQTDALLDTLADQGERVDIVLIFDDQTPGVADLERQVQDVLQEYVAASDLIDIIRIDPTDPRDEAGPLQTVLDRLQAVFTEEVALYEAAIARAESAVEQMETFARSEARSLEAIATRTSAQTDTGIVLRRLRDLVAGMPFDLQQTTDQIDTLLDPDASDTVIPQWTMAAAQYRAALRPPADTLRQAATFFEQVQAASETAREAARAAEAGVEGASGRRDDARILDPAVDEWMTAAIPRYSDLADQIDSASEAIADLPRLRLEGIVREIRDSRSVLLMSESNATLLPFERLFPEPSATEVASGQRIDRRFAGEQVIASGLYQLVQETAQTVVFVHAENRPGGIMRGEAGVPDVLIAAGLLRDLGFETQTWNLREESEQPEVDRTGGPPVWVLVPPPSAVGGSGESMEAGMQMLAAAEDLLAAGERVLINVHPSTLPSFGQDDPWQSVLERIGVEAATGTVIYREIAGDAGRRQSVPALTLREYNPTHPIGRALNGLETYFEAAIPLDVTDPDTLAPMGEGTNPSNEPAVLAHGTVLSVEPSATVWAEPEWFAQREHSPPANAATMAAETDAWPIVLTVERRRPGADVQRVMVVGSGGWFYSDILGSRTQVGQNLFIQFPGNADLITNGCLWLAGRDEAIAGGAFARSAPRIEGLDPGEAILWRWIVIAGLPALSLVFGTLVWYLRRG
ncbi:MAG: DUF7088 domain-containing protein [Planctomycetota bacterium]